MDPITGALLGVLLFLGVTGSALWLISSWAKAVARSYLIDHFDSINLKLKPFGFTLEYQVSEAYDEQVVHLFRLLDFRSGISSPWASPTIALKWINRMKEESIELVFSDALRYDIHTISKRKPLPFDISSRRLKK